MKQPLIISVIMAMFTIVILLATGCAPLNISDNQRAQTLMWLADRWSEPREAQEVVAPPVTSRQCVPVDNGYYTTVVCR